MKQRSIHFFFYFVFLFAALLLTAKPIKAFRFINAENRATINFNNCDINDTIEISVPSPLPFYILPSDTQTYKPRPSTLIDLGLKPQKQNSARATSFIDADKPLSLEIDLTANNLNLLPDTLLADQLAAQNSNGKQNNPFSVVDGALVLNGMPITDRETAVFFVGESLANEFFGLSKQATPSTNPESHEQGTTPDLSTNSLYQNNPYRLGSTVFNQAEKLNTPHQQPIGNNTIPVNIEEVNIANSDFTDIIAEEKPIKGKKQKKSTRRSKTNLAYAKPALSSAPVSLDVSPITPPKSYANSTEKILLTDIYEETIPCFSHYNYSWDTNNPYCYGYAVKDMPFAVEFLLTHGVGEDFRMPVNGALTSGFGQRWGRAHNGMDLDLNTGDPVRAAFKGMVRIAKYSSGYGNLVVVRHWNGLETFYGHLSKILVAPNQVVQPGDIIGLGGSTGRSTGSHLHFEIRYLGQPFDPTDFINVRDQKLHSHTITLFRSSLKSTNPFELPEDDDHYNDHATKSNGKRLNAKTKNQLDVDEHQTASSSASLNTTPSNNLNSPAIGVTDVLQAPVKLDPTYEGQITIGGSDNTDFENEETGNLKDEFETETANESSNYPDVAKSTKLKATKPKSHITKRGESLYTISQKYGISLNDLYKINKMSAKTRLDVGQKIKLSK